MRSYISIYIIGLLLTVACTTEAQKVKIAPYEILHDNSSKVWILDNQFENGIDRTPYNRLDKWVITFYSDQTFVLTTLNHFADYSLHQGRFRFNNDNTILYFDWNSGQTDENEMVLIDRFNLIYKIKQSETSILKVHFVPVDKNPCAINLV